VVPKIVIITVNLSLFFFILLFVCCIIVVFLYTMKARKFEPRTLCILPQPLTSRPMLTLCMIGVYCGHMFDSTLFLRQNQFYSILFLP